MRAGLLHGLDEIQHVAPERGAQGREGLVQQQHRPVAHQGAGDGDALALAARNLAGLAVGKRREAHFGEGGIDALGLRGIEAAATGEMPSATFCRRSRWAKTLLSWKIMLTGRWSGGAPVTSVPLISDAARQRLLEAGDEVEQRRLAAAARGR